MSSLLLHVLGSSTEKLNQEPKKRIPPPLHTMTQMEGYEFVTFAPKVIPPPQQYISLEVDERLMKPKRKVSNYVMDETAVRKSLSNFVQAKRFYNKNAVQQCAIESIEATCGYQYKLRTYCERREVCWTFEPYDSTGTIPLLPTTRVFPKVWDIDVPHNIPNYKDGTFEMEIPYTASTHACHVCDGQRGEPCPGHHCEEGKIVCHYCHGEHKSDRPEDQECHDEHIHCAACSCYGWTLCDKCNGFGKLKCTACDGKGQLKCYIKLILHMENHKSDDFVDKSEGWHTHELPEEAAMEGKGEVVFEEQGARVWPIEDFPDSDVAELSTMKIHKHQHEYNDALFHCQYQTVSITPVTRVVCDYKDEKRHFYIFGKESKVHFPNFWSKNCTIL